VTENHQIQNIVIVGGGSAGWMTASSLRTVLPPSINVLQIESPRVATVGVGEGTIPTIRTFLKSLQVDEREWMTACQATFKMGVRFDNWCHGSDWWWHPFFFRHPKYDEKRLVDSWVLHRSRGMPQFQNAASLYDYCISWQLAEERRCPRFRSSYGSFQDWDSDHSFHLDAAKFGAFLRDHIAVPRGVEHIVAHVDHVTCDEHGRIRQLLLDSGRTVDGDFFVDCSGFRRLLMNAVNETAWTSFSNDLLCDRAIAIQVPYQDVWSEMRPFTRSTALSCGWVWQIGLFDRIGTGYVYSSAFISDDEAENELRQFIGRDRVSGINANRIPFEAGHLKNPWSGNCVAIGLSEGFVEPLEATALGVTQHHIAQLGRILKQATYSVDQVRQYNQGVRRVYDEIRLFLLAHYCFTSRTDTAFWKTSGALASPLTDSIRDGNILPTAETVGTQVFSPQSWLCLLNGFGQLPNAPLEQSRETLNMAEMQQARDSQQSVRDGFVRQLTYLRQYH
jgi:Tryptophan halogenase